MDTLIYLKAIGGLLCVLSLLGGLAYGLRWLKNKGYYSVRPSPLNRLKHLETLKIAPNRHLILVKNDHFTHLILVGPPDLLIHTTTCSSEKLS